MVESFLPTVVVRRASTRFVMDPILNLFGWRYFYVPVVCFTFASDHRPAIASRDRVIDMTRQRGWWNIIIWPDLWYICLSFTIVKHTNQSNVGNLFPLQGPKRSVFDSLNGSNFQVPWRVQSKFSCNTWRKLSICFATGFPDSYPRLWTGRRLKKNLRKESWRKKKKIARATWAFGSNFSSFKPPKEATFWKKNTPQILHVWYINIDIYPIILQMNQI